MKFVNFNNVPLYWQVNETQAEDQDQGQNIK